MSTTLRIRRSPLFGPGLALAIGATGMIPHKAHADCSGDPKSPIEVSIGDRGMRVSVGTLYKMEDDSGKVITYSSVRCMGSNPAVEIALDKAVRDICNPDVIIGVRYKGEIPSQKQFLEFCAGAGYPRTKLNSGFISKP